MATVNKARHPVLRSLALASTLALVAACSDSNDVTETGAALPASETGAGDTSEAATETSGSETAGGEAISPPDAADDPAALAEQAFGPEVMGREFPFAAAPDADASVMIEMSDGVQLAAGLYLPDGDAAASPVVYIDEWYGRAVEVTGHAIDLYRQAGFAVAIVDARGYGASFGAQPGFSTERSKQDQREVLAWLAAQPWSNGQVSTVGLSLSGALAGVMTGSGSPQLGAAVIRQADYNQYDLNLYPGGIANANMMGMVVEFVNATHWEPCLDDAAACASLGVLPAPGDHDLSLLRAAMREHRGNIDPSGILSAIYSDDRVGEGTWSSMTAAEHPEVRVPARVVASWVDGLTADSALRRYASHRNTPMQVVIGSTTHTGALDGDPFSTTPFAEARPSALESSAEDIEFLRSVFAGEPIGREIRYVVLGDRGWKTTEVWPPEGVTSEAFTLAPGALTHGGGEAGSITHRVDPTTSTGPLNRWASQRAAPIHYGDRRNAPGRFLSFDAAPVELDTELVGSPELCLELGIDQVDGIVLAYLEDVAPDGRVTYLTEGELRLLHRATNGAACDPAPGTARSFAREDAAAVIPGETLRVEIPLSATAARIRRGHHLRLSLAGADAGTFAPLVDAPVTWTVGYGPDASSLRIPTRPWQGR
jgi:putative CocE/NonD family hydrolase